VHTVCTDFSPSGGLNLRCILLLIRDTKNGRESSNIFVSFSFYYRSKRNETRETHLVLSPTSTYADTRWPPPSLPVKRRRHYPAMVFVEHDLPHPVLAFSPNRPPGGRSRSLRGATTRLRRQPPPRKRRDRRGWSWSPSAASSSWIRSLRRRSNSTSP
jgi:hypothetical protein